MESSQPSEPVQNVVEEPGQAGDHEVIESLLLALSAPDWHVAQAAAAALAELGETAAVQPLIAALASEDRHISQAAATALGELADARAVQPLLLALSAPNWHVRQSAAGALGRIGDPRAIDPLVAALLARDAEVRHAAIEALDSTGWAPRNARERAACSIANDEWSTCVEIGAPAVEPLVTILGVGGAGVREAAAAALGRIGDPSAIDPLVAALVDYYPNVREASATALGRIGDPRAVEPLVAALRGRYPEVLQAAAAALGVIGGPAVEPLIAVFDDPGSRAEERVWAAQSLVDIYQSGRLGEAERLDILRRRQQIERTHYDAQGGAYCASRSRHADQGVVFVD